MRATTNLPMPTSGPFQSARPEALQVLLDASAMLLATPSESAVLSGILDLASKLFHADAYAVWRAFDGGAVWRAVATRGLSSSFRTEIHDGSTPLTSVYAVEDTSEDAFVSRYQAVYVAENIRSLLIVPLLLHGGSTATITFYWHTPRSFSQLDKDYAAALSNLSAAALTISELHEQNQREKGRLTFLAEASSVLSSSLEYETTLQQVAHLAVPHIADWCIVHVVEEGNAQRLVLAHADPAMQTLAEEYSQRYPEEIRPDRGLGLLLRTGASEFFPRITEEQIVPAARDPEHLALLLRLRITASILVPLTSRGAVLGAIRLLASGGTRHFTQDDLQLAEDLARRAGAAIENARLHRAVVDQRKSLSLAHAAARMGSWSFDIASRRMSLSDEFKAIHGLPPDSDLVYQPGAFVHPDDREKVLAELNALLASSADQLSFEHRALSRTGQLLWVESHGRIQRNSDGQPTGIAGITMDITARRMAETALRRTEKLAAAGRLAATVAHEVNNPLEALMNLVYLAQHTDGIPDQAQTYLRIASDEINRMAHVVRQTLGFYRESVHPAETDLGPVVSEVLDLYRSRANTRSLHLTCQTESGLKAMVNAGEIRQVIANLVSNAIDATPPGGSIRACVRRVEEHIEIQVADTGSGIAPVHLDHLFEPFFTTKSDVGTGLGLWVSKGIIEKHNGTIAVASSGSGTTMTVTLPSL